MYKFYLINDSILQMIIIIILTEDEFLDFKKRDPLILERIYREYNKKVFNFIIIKTNGNIDIANEVVSETFYAMIASAPNIKNNKNIQNWLLKIASRKLCDYFRKKSSDEKKINLMKDFSDGYAEDVEEDQDILMINLAFENVKEKYKKILELKYIRRKSLNEISKLLAKPHTTINGLLVRARKALKKEYLKIAKEF
jgi:RNA polymerase sigma factor (sigma-70 family)